MNDTQAVPVVELDTQFSFDTAEQIIDSALNGIRGIYEQDPQHQLEPMSLARSRVNGELEALVMPLGEFYQDDDGKTLLEKIAPRVATELKFVDVVSLSEGWLVMMDASSPEVDLYESGKLRPSESGQRIEVIQLTYEHPDYGVLGRQFELTRNEDGVEITELPQSLEAWEALRAGSEDYALQARIRFFPNAGK